MKTPLIFVELKSGHSDNGPAWIGKGTYSRSKRMIYFDGKALAALRPRENFASHVEHGTGNFYWVSRVKKDRTDRHWAGSGIIQIDREVVDEYVELTGGKPLPRSRYRIVELDNSDIRDQVTTGENAPQHREALENPA